MKRPLFLAATCLTALAGQARSENIDYGTLETLFGEAVTTSATGAAMRLPDAPATMEIITADEIRMSGETDIPGILSRVSGISTQRFSRNQTDVSVRGYNRSATPRLLVLVNGRQVYLDVYGFTQWDLIPVQLEEIRQIEIVKGPNTALFGFNAAAGVVNIITFNPLFDDRDVANLRVDSLGGVQGSLVESLSLGDRLFVRGSVGGFTTEHFDGTQRDPTFIAGDPTRLAGSLDIKVKLNEKSILTLEATGSKLDVYERLPIPTIRQQADYEQSSYRATLDSEGSWGLFSLIAYQNNTRRSFLLAGGGDSPEVDMELRVLKAEDVIKPLPAHTVRIAAEYRQNEIEQKEPVIGDLLVPPFQLDYEVLSSAAMWNWEISDKLTSTVAARVDHLKAGDDLTEPSYNAALVYQATDAATVRLQASRGVQVPSLFDIVLSGDLSPVTVDNYALDFQQQLPRFGGALRASVFYQENSDLRQLLLQPGQTFASRPTGDSALVGFELALEGATGPLSWDLSYTHLEVEDDLSPEAALQRIGDFTFETTTPTSNARAALAYERGGFSLSSALRYETEREFLDPFAPGGVRELDAYTALDTRIAYRLRDRVTIALEAQDLTNDDTPQVQQGALETRAQLALTVDY